jgi:hypothetical protein
MLRIFLNSASGRGHLLATKWRALPFIGFVIAVALLCTSCGALTQAPTRIQAVGASGAQGNQAVPQKGDANFPADGSARLGEHDDQTAADQADDAASHLRALDPADPANLPLFREALSDEDPSLKEAAIQVLAGQGGPAALDLLGEAFHNSDPALKLTVIENIGSIPEAFALLQEASQDVDAVVREAAQRSLDLQADLVSVPVPAAGPEPPPTPVDHPYP